MSSWPQLPMDAPEGRQVLSTSLLSAGAYPGVCTNHAEVASCADALGFTLFRLYS